MFGQTSVILYAITAVSLIAFATDVTVGKIFNWLVLPAIGLALIAAFHFSGIQGLGNALLGALSGLILYGWIFALGLIGGGDVKFLMALGAWGGCKFAFEVAVLSILLGGVMAIGVLLYKKRAFDFLVRMQVFVASMFIKEMGVQKPELDKKLQMPFGIPMAIAAVLIAWGVPIWPY